MPPSPPRRPHAAFRGVVGGVCDPPQAPEWPGALRDHPSEWPGQAAPALIQRSEPERHEILVCLLAVQENRPVIGIVRYIPQNPPPSASGSRTVQRRQKGWASLRPEDLEQLPGVSRMSPRTPPAPGFQSGGPYQSGFCPSTYVTVPGLPALRGTIRDSARRPRMPLDTYNPVEPRDIGLTRHAVLIGCNPGDGCVIRQNSPGLDDIPHP